MPEGDAGCISSSRKDVHDAESGACCRELRAKDLERLKNVVEDLRAKEKKGLTKDQKEELAIALKVTEWVEGGTDVRCAVMGGCLLLCSARAGRGV